MDIVVTQTASVEKQSSVGFACPTCGVEGPGICAKVVYRGKLFFIIPIFKSSVTRIRCQNCASEFQSGLDYGALVALPPAQIAQALSPSVSFVTKALTIIGFVLLLVPVVDVVSFGVAFLAAFTSSSKWRKVALVGAVLSAIWTVVFFAYLASGS